MCAFTHRVHTNHPHNDGFVKARTQLFLEFVISLVGWCARHGSRLQCTQIH